MRKNKLVLAVLFFLLLPLSGFAKRTDVMRLLYKSAHYDRKVVEIEAEAVGLLKRKDGFWLNVSQDNSDIGVWLAKDKNLPLPQHFAGYYQKGDIVYIKGIFHAACPSHQGDVDIHALEIRILKSGGKIPESVLGDKKIFALIMLAIFLVCAMFFSYRQKQWKQKF